MPEERGLAGWREWSELISYTPTHTRTHTRTQSLFHISKYSLYIPLSPHSLSFSNGSFFFKDFFFNKDLFFKSLLNLSICYDIVSVLHFGVFLVFFLVTRYVGS